METNLGLSDPHCPDWLARMDASERTAQRAAYGARFGTVAHAYAQGRPDYPDEAVRWLAGDPGNLVAELGAGTGKLTGSLLAGGHRVVATEPSRALLDQLTATYADEDGALPPALVPMQAVAESMPFADGSVDHVLAAQAFHWFDSRRALEEIARVLRPSGAIGLSWNFRDESVPWVRRLSEVIGSEGPADDPTPVIVESGLFDDVQHARFRMWQRVDRDSLAALVESRSYVANRPRHERQTILGRVRELYDESARAPEGLVLPYTTVCYRARVNALSRRRVDADNLFWS